MVTSTRERVPSKKILPRRGTPERRQIEDRRACCAFWGPNGSCGGHPSDFDEPPDLTEALSALTYAEWQESQIGNFSEMPDPDKSEMSGLGTGERGLAYPPSWYGFVRNEFGSEYVMPD